jgi:hypothetical protein
VLVTATLHFVGDDMGEHGPAIGTILIGQL